MLSFPTLDAVHLFHQFAFLACLGILVPHLNAGCVVIAPIAGIDFEANSMDMNLSKLREIVKERGA